MNFKEYFDEEKTKDYQDIQRLYKLNEEIEKVNLKEKKISFSTRNSLTSFDYRSLLEKIVNHHISLELNSSPINNSYLRKLESSLVERKSLEKDVDTPVYEFYENLLKEINRIKDLQETSMEYKEYTETFYSIVLRVLKKENISSILMPVEEKEMEFTRNFIELVKEKEKELDVSINITKEFDKILSKMNKEQAEVITLNKNYEKKKKSVGDVIEYCDKFSDNITKRKKYIRYSMLSAILSLGMFYYGLKEVYTPIYLKFDKEILEKRIEEKSYIFVSNLNDKLLNMFRNKEENAIKDAYQEYHNTIRYFLKHKQNPEKFDIYYYTYLFSNSKSKFPVLTEENFNEIYSYATSSEFYDNKKLLRSYSFIFLSQYENYVEKKKQLPPNIFELYHAYRSDKSKKGYSSFLTNYLDKGLNSK